ncbi:MAG: VOC family protein [Chloroflexota bacterium]
MRILSTTLHTADIDAQRAFYTDTLGFPLVSATSSSFTVAAGCTRLTFRASAGNERHAHHIAFNIPPHQLEEALAWTEGRVTLLPHDDEIVVHFSSWEAKAFYFEDAAGNILEMIARNRTPALNASSPFSATSVLGLGEVGLAVDVLPTLTGLLQDGFGVPYFDGDPTGTFCALGDDDGLLIAVETERAWIPTDDCLSGAYPVAVTFEGDVDCTAQVEGHTLRQVTRQN